MKAWQFQLIRNMRRTQFALLRFFAWRFKASEKSDYASLGLGQSHIDLT